MKIVVLDGYTVNPGDLSWDSLRVLGQCTIYDRTPAELIVERIADAVVVLTNKVVMSQDVIRKSLHLRYIGVLATGYNVVDVAVALEHGVTVTNVPAYSTASVAQLTFALVLELAQRVGDHAGVVRSGQWSTCADFSFTVAPLTELAGRTMGIIGLGQIGQAVARIARAFDMSVLATVRSPRSAPDGVELVDLDTLLRESDIVSLHCPLTSENAGMINAAALALMKPTAYLINTSRGPLVNEQDLADALQNKRLAGAGLDVLSTEPPAEDNPLLSAPNCLVTPHIAWETHAARTRLMQVAVANVRAFIDGKPTNVVT